jgi:hypothetical protein
VALIQQMRMQSRRRASERRRHHLLWIYTFVLTVLHAAVAEDLYRREHLLAVERIAVQVALRRLARTVRTSTFGAEIFRPYINLRYWVDKELMSDNKFRTDFGVDSATFHQLHDALQFPPVMRAADRLALYSRDALLILSHSLGEPSRESTVADFSSRDGSAISRFVKLICLMITAHWFAALLLEPYRLTLPRFAQYARVTELQGIPFPKLVGFLDGSRYAFSDHPDEGVCHACWSAKYTSNLAYQGVVGPDETVLDCTGPFVGSKADGTVFIESTHVYIYMYIASTYSCHIT